MEKIVSIIILILYGVVMLLMCYIAIFQKEKKPKNNVHFYVARDKDGTLWLYMGRPYRGKHEFEGVICLNGNYFGNCNLNRDDYSNLKWEDEPVEVFINLED